DEHRRAQEVYAKERSDLTPDERDDSQHSVNQAGMAAVRKFQSIWLSYSCLNYKYGTGSEKIALDNLKLEQQVDIGCWEKLGFDWYVFASAPHKGVRPFR